MYIFTPSLPRQQGRWVVFIHRAIHPGTHRRLGWRRSLTPFHYTYSPVISCSDLRVFFITLTFPSTEEFVKMKPQKFLKCLMISEATNELRLKVQKRSSVCGEGQTLRYSGT